ncbi:MAG: DUF2934 domain-containing protein [Alphaproteobacteria bacterium]
MGMELIERIRERAYQLWEAEGCVHGRDMEYWFRAEAEISAEAAVPPPEPESAKASRTKAASAEMEGGAKPVAAKTSRAKRA